MRMWGEGKKKEVREGSRRKAVLNRRKEVAERGKKGKRKGL